jgi:hypothetical protein
MERARESAVSSPGALVSLLPGGQRACRWSCGLQKACCQRLAAAGAGVTDPAADGPAPGAPAQPAPADPPASQAPKTGAAAGAAEGAQDQPDSHAVGSGREAADATSRSGQGSERHGFLRDFDRLYIERDAPGGGVHNVINLPGAKQPRPRRAPAELTALVRKAFVEPEGFDDVRRSFGLAHQTVILRGPEGCGKLGAAIRLLLGGGVEQIFLLDAATDMRSLAEAIETDAGGLDRVEADAGFILNQPPDFASLQASVLQGLEDSLSRAGARQVLTVNAGILGPDQDLPGYMIDLPGAPRPDEVAASHLRHLMGAARADELLALPEAQKLIAECLPAGSSCQAAADLAEAITSDVGLAAEVSDIHTARVRAQVLRRGSEDFEIWFAGLGDTRTATFAIALAVLNGFPYEIVVRAARLLYGRLADPPQMVMTAADDPSPEGHQPFRVGRRELLHRLRAQVTDITIRDRYGASTAEAAEYTSPAYPALVILHAWSRYEIQDVLLEWLKELAEDGRQAVRIFASGALGLLATRSLYYVTGHVLLPWSRSDQGFRRESVAYALRCIAADGRLRDNARRLITGWYASSDEPAAQSTAARAYGLAAGIFDPITAFEALDRLLAVDDIRVTIAIGDAVVDLLGDGSDDLAGPAADDLGRFVLQKLLDGLGQPARAVMAQLVFLIVADGLNTEVTSVDGTHRATWPFLLRLGLRLPPARDALAELWRYVLNDARFPGEAGDVLTRWASYAEADPETRQVFLRLVRAIVRGHHRTQMIVRRHAVGWTAAGNLRPLPLASAAVQAILDAERAPA